MLKTKNLEREIKRVKGATFDCDIEMSKEDIENAMNELCQKGLVVKNKDGSFSLSEDARTMAELLDLEDMTGVTFTGVKEEIEKEFERKKEEK